MANNISNYLEKFLEKDSLFTNKKVLQAIYDPDNVIHREEQLKQIAKILAPALRKEKPSNLFVYGKTGTGKTVSVKHVSKEMMNIANDKDIPLKIFYINCKLKRVADTEYRLIAQLIREFGIENVPATGLPTDEIYNIFIRQVEKQKQNIILILDEIDQLVFKAGDEIIYNLTRINSDLKNSQISIVGISNDLSFTNTLDPRVKSSLSEEEIVFPPYNAIQLQSILRQRADSAFKKGIIQEGVVEKCAAYAAREHGDARRALELLRVAGELAERNSQTSILVENIDQAEDKIEKDRFVDIIKNQPQQFQCTLYSIFQLSQNTKKFYTGEVYDYYKEVCKNINLRPLTQRRVSDIIGELDMLGIINGKTISNGRFGRTREISISLPSNIKPKIKKILEEDLGLSH